MLSIGEFSKICFVTRKTLRYYDEIGLLKPQYTADTGYRYYTGDQLQTMRLITRLKSYDFSLVEIAQALEERDPEKLAERILTKRLALGTELDARRRLLEQMEQDAEKLKRRMDIMENKIKVETVNLPAQTVYGHRGMMAVQDFGKSFAALYGEVAEKDLKVVGPPLAFYYDEEFDPCRSDIEVAVPVEPGTQGARVHSAGLCCYATHVGDYDERFSAVYAQLAQWIEDNGYQICGAPFDRYCKGYAHDGAAPQDFVTEIYFPIRKA